MGELVRAWWYHFLLCCCYILLPSSWTSTSFSGTQIVQATATGGAFYHEGIGHYQIYTYGRVHYFLVNGTKAISPDRYTFETLAKPPRENYPMADKEWVGTGNLTKLPSLFHHQSNEYFLSLPSSKAIIETKKIFHILNPSFIYWNDKIVISWRFDNLFFRVAVLDRAKIVPSDFSATGGNGKPKPFKSLTKVERVELDLLMLQKVKFNKMTRVFKHYGEDPRLIAIGPPGLQRLYVVFCMRHTLDKPELQMAYLELALKHPNATETGVYEVERVNYTIAIEFPERKMEDQKNWAPFKSINPGENKILFVGSIHPHRVVKVDISKERANKGIAKTVAITNYYHHSHMMNNFAMTTTHDAKTKKVNPTATAATPPPPPTLHSALSHYPWPYGDMRGGTQAMLYEKNKFLSFFHASTTPKYPNITKTYNMGAYTFCAKPPYHILGMSSDPIVHETMYTGMWPDLPRSYYLMDYIVFPMSFLIVEDKIFLTYGRQDREGWVAKMSLSKLIASLKPTNHTCK